MAITIDWPAKIISVPKADTLLVQSSPIEIRELNLDALRLRLKDLEDDEEGMPFPRTHNHNTTVTVGGVTLARVIEIINGYTVTFESGAYAVNLVGANSNVGDVVNLNAVSVRSSNSAGLVQTREIQYASFADGVTVDVIGGAAGQAYPLGSRAAPVNNMVDALAIAELYGFSRFYIVNSLTLASGDFSRKHFESEGHGVVITLAAGAVLTETQYAHVTVTGTTTSGGLHFFNGTIQDLTFAGHMLHNCGIAGTVTPTGGNVMLDRCYGADNSANPPIVDLASFGGTGEVVVHGYSGELRVINKVGTQRLQLNGLGQFTLDPSVTNGPVTVVGGGLLTDNSAGATVDASGFVSRATVASAVWDAPRASHVAAATFGADALTSTAAAQAVWDALATSHVTAGTMGDLARLTAGMTQQNYLLDSTTYDAAGLMTAGRMRLFASPAAVAAATDGGTGEGEIATFTVAATASGGSPGLPGVYRVARA